jgi:MFS transporter, FHS family, glucose/mannose:H+ symporter
MSADPRKTDSVSKSRMKPESSKQHFRIRLSMFLNYFVFAILLNSVGTVILQMINQFGVSSADASVLAVFKELTIAISSFAVASFLPRIGYRASMLIGLGLVTAACLVMALSGGSFLASKAFFACIGLSFALMKVSIYSTIGMVTSGEKEHASLTSHLEGVFMIGMLAGYWIFGYFIARTWTDTYWVLAALTSLAFLLLLVSPLDESAALPPDPDFRRDFLAMIRLVRYPLVGVFVVSVFLYVIIEQAIGSWLPVFNSTILQLPSAMSVQFTSILAGATALGRLLGGWVMKKVSWIAVLVASLAAAMLLVVLVLPLSRAVVPGSVTGWLSAPLAAFVFPMIGLFLATIYPTLCSTILSRTPQSRHSAMTGLIVIFSALGGALGSRLTGMLFGMLDGVTAFYCTLAPMTGLLLLLFPYEELRRSFSLGQPEET